MNAKKRNKLNWECAANHFPDWMENDSHWLSAVISDKDHNRVMGMLRRYNELTDKEMNYGNDGNAIYGIAQEKDDLITDVIKIYEKYKNKVVEYKRKLKL